MISNKNGFTLIEMVLYIGIVAIMLSSITSFFFLFIDARIRNTAQQKVEYEGEHIMQFIAETVQYSSAITVPMIGVDSAELSATVYDVAYGERRVYLDQGVLMVEDASGVYALTSEAVQVTDLVFRQVGTTATRESIYVTYTLSTVSHSSQSAYTYEDTFTTTITRR